MSLEENIRKQIEAMCDEHLSRNTSIGSCNSKRASLSIPLYKGKLLLAKRNTEPHRGKYSAIGGKAERTSVARVLAPVHLVEKQGGHKVESLRDKFARAAGRETTAEAGLREFCEEFFSNKSYPCDFHKSNFHMYLLGDVYDVLFDCIVDFHLLLIPSKFKPSPSERELGDIAFVEKIDPKEINPITKVALEEVRYRSIMGFLPDKYAGVHNQIPFFEVPYMPSILQGAVQWYSGYDVIRGRMTTREHRVELHNQKIAKEIVAAKIRFGLLPRMEGIFAFKHREDGWFDTGGCRDLKHRLLERLSHLGEQEYGAMARAVDRIPRMGREFLTGPYVLHDKVLIPHDHGDAYLGSLIQVYFSSTNLLKDS